MDEIYISSNEFENKRHLPVKYTCDGENINPPIDLDNVPGESTSLAIIVEDPDAPAGTWDHWIVYNIPPTDKIHEGRVPGTQGRNSWGKHEYGGPCPPTGTHRYFFKVFALDVELSLETNSGKEELVAAMEGHIIAMGEIVGLYSRE